MSTNETPWNYRATTDDEKLDLLHRIYKAWTSSDSMRSRVLSQLVTPAPAPYIPDGTLILSIELYAYSVNSLADDNHTYNNESKAVIDVLPPKMTAAELAAMYGFLPLTPEEYQRNVDREAIGKPR